VPSDDGHPDVTVLMNAAADGNTAAAGQLLPLVYEQLRRSAQQRLASERDGHTLSATALVHEAYLKLVGPRQIPWAGRGHFYAAAAQAMRRILIDHARSRAARGGTGLRFEDIGDVGALAAADSEQILAVDAAVARLEAEDPEAAAVVRLRFFAGLSVDQAAEALGISPRTAARVWAYARAVLYRELSEDAVRDCHDR
jgi:RNA polymerase sigma factor (TIGR02999 family)